MRSEGTFGHSGGPRLRRGYSRISRADYETSNLKHSSPLFTGRSSCVSSPTLVKCALDCYILIRVLAPQSNATHLSRGDSPASCDRAMDLLRQESTASQSVAQLRDAFEPAPATKAGAAPQRVRCCRRLKLRMKPGIILSAQRPCWGPPQWGATTPSC